MANVIHCPNCSRALQLAENVPGQQVRCPLCQHVFVPPTATAGAAEPAAAAPPPQPPPGPVGGAPPQQPAAGPSYGGQWSGQPGQTPHGGYAPQAPVSAPGQSPYGDEVYQQGGLGYVDPAWQSYWLNGWRPTPFSVAGAVVLNIFTCGFFGLIYYGLKFDEFPKGSRNDFGAGKAIGFSFIPYFNFYWMFRFWMGLADRVNLQISLRGPQWQPLQVSRSLAQTSCILSLCGFIPYIGGLFSLAGWICQMVLIANVQKAINAMAEAQNVRA